VDADSGYPVTAALNLAGVESRPHLETQAPQVVA
jgi:hypothetical protein